MIKLNNCVSKILYKDNDDSQCILTYIDIDGILEKKFIINYINEIINKNIILQKKIVENNGIFFLNDSIKDFDLNDYYSIKYTKVKFFDNYINNILNNKFTTELEWKFLFCIDKELQKTRFYFKISHAYTDGYQIIKILTTPFQDFNITDKFKRKTDFLSTFYYYFIGTIILLFMNVKVLINILFNLNKNSLHHDKDNNKDNTDTDFIIFKKLKLNKIKKFTTEKKITINDFLYSLMIKTDFLYTKQEKNLLTISPINISGTTQTNNMAPILININNSYNTSNLFIKVNNIFNNFKFSLFIPILSFLINSITPYIHFDILTNWYNNLLLNTDYVYSNIIGPSNICMKKNTYISNIHFLINAKNKEINYNIISTGNNINIICSFKKDIIKNKKLFKKCINNAYHILINT